MNLERHQHHRVILRRFISETEGWHTPEYGPPEEIPARKERRVRETPEGPISYSRILVSADIGVEIGFLLDDEGVEVLEFAEALNGETAGVYCYPEYGRQQ